MSKTPLRAAQVARNVLCEHYHIHTDKNAPIDGNHEEWCPKLYEGDHEEINPDAKVISWEEGVDYQFVYDDEVRVEIVNALQAYAEQRTPSIVYHVDAINHFCLGVYAEPSGR